MAPPTLMSSRRCRQSWLAFVLIAAVSTLLVPSCPIEAGSNNSAFAVPSAPPRASTRMVGLRATATSFADEGTIMKKEDIDETFETKDDKPKGSSAWLVLLSCFFPALCTFFLKGTKIINTVVQGKPPWVEVSTYSGLSLFFFFLVRLKLFGKAAEAFVEVFCSILQRCGVAAWRIEVIKRLEKPLANICEGSLIFLAFNLLVNALPETLSFNLPRLLTFMDSDGSGTLEADEIENFTFTVASRILFGWFALQASLFFNSLKRPPTTPIPENQRSLYARFLSGLQRLKNIKGKDPFAKSTEALVVQSVDKVISVMAFSTVAFSWIGLANMKFSTVLAVGGVGGLAVSLAAKNIMQNVISGGLIFLHRAVVVGDEIRSTDGKISGFVKHIGATNTVVKRLDGEPCIVPNQQLVDNAIVNVQRRDFWLILKDFPLVLDNFECLPNVVDTMEKTLKQAIYDWHNSKESYVLVKEPLVYFDGFGHQGAKLMVKAYVCGTLERNAFYKMQSDILLAVNNAVLACEGVKGYGFEAHYIGGVPPPAPKSRAMGNQL